MEERRMEERIVYLKIRVQLEVEEGVDIDEVVNELDYNIESTLKEAQVIDTEIVDFTFEF